MASHNISLLSLPNMKCCSDATLRNLPNTPRDTPQIIHTSPLKNPQKVLPSPGPSPFSAPDRVITMLQKILEEQSDLRKILRDNQQAIIPRLDDISASVSFLAQPQQPQQPQQQGSSEVAETWAQVEDIEQQIVPDGNAVKAKVSNNSGERVSGLVKQLTSTDLIQKAEKGDQPVHRSLVARILMHPYFEIFIASVILLNTAAMFVNLQLKGLHAGWKLGLRDDAVDLDAIQAQFDMFEHFFMSVYVIELVMRLVVMGRRFPKHLSNLVDALIVLMSCFDIYVFPALNVKSINISVLRMIRLSRILRLGKALRSSNFVSELRVLLRTLRAALSGVFWSVVMLSGIITVGGIIMAQLTINFLDSESISLERRKWMYQNFGTTMASIYTIFESTFTTSWINYSRPLIEEVGYFFVAFWIPWVVLVNFTTMRVVSALFLKETMAVSARDAENSALRQLSHHKILAQCLREIFTEADSSGDGSISQDEFDQMIINDDVIELFSFMGLDMDEVAAFYTVLSADDGQADYVEFLNGALAMASSAPNLDRMKSMQNQMKISGDLKETHTLLKKMCHRLKLDDD